MIWEEYLKRYMRTLPVLTPPAGNPLETIRHIAHPAGVMLGGRWLVRTELDRGLAAIERTLE